MQTRYLPTTEITLHPITARMPAVNPESAEFRALVAMIAETGTVPRPVPVNGFRAVAELDVLAAAKQLGMVTVPTVEIPVLDIPLVAIADLVTRKHRTKSQIAYLAYPVLAAILDASKKRRVENLKKGLQAPKSSQVVDFPDPALRAASGNRTLEELAATLGISDRLLRYAAQIHSAFDAPADEQLAEGELRALFEPRILEQDENGHSAGLGAIVAGIAGYKSTKGQTVIPAPQLTLWEERIERLFSPVKFNGWDRLDDATREAARQKFAAEFYRVVPEDLQSAVLAQLTTRNRRAA